MNAYNTDIAAVARHQIEYRVRDAEARHMAKAARASTDPNEPAPAQRNPARRWIRHSRRAIA